MTEPSFPSLEQRFDPLSCFHKTHHLAVSQTLARLSAADPRAPACVRLALGEVYDMLRYCERLTRAIGYHVVSWTEAQCPERAVRIALHCDEQLWSIAGLGEAHGAVVSMNAGMRGQALVSLQQGVRAYAAHALKAMAHTESEALAVLWAAHGDRELARLEKAILGEFDSTELKYAMQWLIPAIHIGERVRIVSLLDEHDDDRLTGAFVAMSKDLLCRDDYEQLLEALAPARTGAMAGMMHKVAARTRQVS